MTNVEATFAQAGEQTFIGHPKGLFYPAFTEAWERFSYYGMTALLALYMVNQLLLPGHVEHIAGFAGFRAAVESLVGPLSSLASVVGVPLLFWIWRHQASRRREPDELAKIGVGAWITAASHLILVAAMVGSGGAAISPI